MKECRKGRIWELFSGPLPPHPTRHFNLFLGPRRQACFEPPRPWVTFSTLPSPLPSLLRATTFGSSSSVPKMDLSRSTLWVMAGGIYRMPFPSGFRPSLPSRPPSLSLGVYSLFSRIHVSSHGRTIIAIPACLFRPHWTIPVSREETLTIREKFRAVSWRQPNHKPNTTKCDICSRDTLLPLSSVDLADELRALAFAPAAAAHGW